MKQDLFAPIELIEPLTLMADVERDSHIIVKCNGPGYICEVGSCQ